MLKFFFILRRRIQPRSQALPLFSPNEKERVPGAEVEIDSVATYDSAPSLITNVSSQSSFKLDFRLFRLAAAVGFLRPFSEPDLPSGILDF